MPAIKKAPAGNDVLRVRPNPVVGGPLTAELAAIGGKWKRIIVYWLSGAPRHFAALRQEMPDISQKVLTQQLRELISDGIVLREPQGPIPAPVVYSLTEHGRTVLPLVEDVRMWGRAPMTHRDSLPDRLVQTSEASG
jgi:DNA-binding HxlR family transcriptional regulator